MVELKTDIKDAEFKRIIRGLEGKGKNLKPPLKRSGIWMIRSVDKNFKAGGRPHRWKELAPNTLAKKAPKRNPLQDSGMLRLSVLSKTGKGTIYRLRKDSLKMGTNLRYASAQQYGTAPRVLIPARKRVLRFRTVDGFIYRPSVNHPGIPPRPFLLFQDEDVKAIVKIFSDYMME